MGKIRIGYAHHQKGSGNCKISYLNYIFCLWCGNRFCTGYCRRSCVQEFHINSPEEWITLLAVAGIGMVIGIFFGSLVIPLLFKFGAEKARMLSIAAFAAPAAIGMALYKLLDMFGIPLSEKFITNLLYLSPLLVIVWVYVMYLISCHIFQKQDI